MSLRRDLLVESDLGLVDRAMTYESGGIGRANGEYLGGVPDGEGSVSIHS